jgi:hypothetical protein
MSTFDQREEAFEKRFALEEEQLFKVNARRNKMLGRWAAQMLGKTGSAAEAYAQAVVEASVTATGDGILLAKIMHDLSGKGVSAVKVRQKMDEFRLLAENQLKAAP